MIKNSPEYLNCLKENKLKEIEVKVKPRKKGVYGGTGYVWEYLLSVNGWNDLSEDKKFGIIDDYCRGADGNSYWAFYGVQFPHCNDIKIALFVGEFDIVNYHQLKQVVKFGFKSHKAERNERGID